MADTKVEDLRLPATVIARIVKDALPAGAAVSKEARTSIARAAAVFILNLTTYANDYAGAKKRKTVTAEDVYQAVRVIECDHIEKPLKEAVEMWKIIKAHKNEEARRRKADKKDAQKLRQEEILVHEDVIDEDQYTDIGEDADTLPVTVSNSIISSDAGAVHDIEDVQ